MSLLIKKPGILTTVQDLGRRGFARFGINQNGVMDQAAVRLINILLGNSQGEAVVEMHFPAAEIKFERGCDFAIGGGDFGATLDGDEISNWRVYTAKPNDILRCREKILGSCLYLAVRGGFSLESWLESASTNLAANIGGFDGRALKSGDRLKVNQMDFPTSLNRNRLISPAIIPVYSAFPTVRVIAGAEFHRLKTASGTQFFDQDYTIAINSNRMGYRLAGVPLELKRSLEIVSSAVTFGTVQLLPNGQLIVLMADHQTSGGYPRLANVIAIDLPLLAQLGAGDKVAFHPVSLAEAEELKVSFERDINLLKVACKF